MDLAWMPKRQGNAGELSAITWLDEAGAAVSKQLFEHSDYDLIADFLDGRVWRVQVKTSTCFRNGRFEVMLATRGGNQSWNRVIKRVDSTRCDALFVHVADGRRWFIPAEDHGGSSGLRLGGPKYAAYEVQPGSRLQSRSGPTE
jgi:hypothetical protein